MRNAKKCRCCHRWFIPLPHLKNQQKVCSRKACQKIRRRHTQKQNRIHHPVSLEKRREWQKKWLEGRPNYWREYRAKCQKYVKRNRRLQHRRDKKRRNLAKRDSWESIQSEKLKRIERLSLLAKRDSCQAHWGRFIEEMRTYLKWVGLLAKRDVIAAYRFSIPKSSP